MASHLSARKRARQNEKARLRNRAWKSELKTLKKGLEQAIAEKKADVVTTLYPSYVSTVDQAVSRGVLHKNNAARKKSRMALKVNSVGKAAG